MGPVYTASQLLALRPLLGDYQGAIPGSVGGRLQFYYALWRRFQELDVPGARWFNHEPTYTILRYSYVLPNKEFKRRWVKTHGTSAGLKDLPRHSQTMLDVRGKSFVHYLQRLRSFVSGLDRHQTQRCLQTAKASKEAIVPKKWERSRGRKRPGKRYREGQLITAKIQTVSESEKFLRVIGGLTYSIKSMNTPPPKGKEKYWYFYRKNRGYWHASEHHPYGDEYTYALQ